jgi:EpsI family protein
MKKSFLVSLMICLLMVLSAAIAIAITPVAGAGHQHDQPNLDALIPLEFNGWKIDESGARLVVDPDVNGEIKRLYSQTLTRTYINNRGEGVMLSIAYGGDQRTDLQVHRPEVCYVSSGFDVGKLTKAFMDTTIGRIPVMRLVAKKGTRNEPITYWIRIGDSLARGWYEQKMATLRYYMLTGKLPDGLLFRVSTISNDVPDSYHIQQQFLTSLLQAVRNEDRHWLVGRLAQSC